MNTECTAAQLEFHGLGRRSVVGQFDGGKISSDGCDLLLMSAVNHDQIEFYAHKRGANHGRIICIGIGRHDDLPG